MTTDQVPATERPTAPTLNKQHIRRLRFYAGHNRSAPHGDMTDLDLEVLGLICIKRDARWHHQPLEVTDQGRLAIYQDRQAVIAAQSPHHELASRLAQWLRGNSRLTWENIEFRVEVAPNDICFVRPDVFSIVATHEVTRLAPVIHEVKVSRADFLSDVAKPRKRQAYLQLAGAVTYVAPEGIIKPDEVPEGCGLLQETSPGIFVRGKNVRAKRIQLNHWSMMNLVLKSYGNAGAA